MLKFMGAFIFKMEKEERIYEDQTLQECYEAGVDAKKNGGNINNSHFRFFTSPDRTKAWERGNKPKQKNNQNGKGP